MSTALRIILEGDNAFPELQGKNVKGGTLDAIAALPGGMASGRTSVGLLVYVDGQPVLAQTSLRNLQMAAAAFTGKYGDETGNAVVLSTDEDGTVHAEAHDLPPNKDKTN